MKKKLALLLFTLPLFAVSQNSALFKYNFEPNHSYIQNIDQKENNEIAYLGDSLFTQRLRENKLKSYESSESLQHIETLIKTDSIINDSIFRMVLEFTKTEDKNKKPIVSKGSRLSAHCNTHRFFPLIDSVSVLGKTKDNSQTIIELSKAAILKFDFPENELTIGEVFYRKYPALFPGKDNEQIVVTVVTGYKLLKIENGIGKFDIRQVYKINLGRSKVRPTITAEGKGTMYFDIKEHFYTKYELNTKLVYSVKREKYTVQTTTNSTVNQKVIINEKK